MIKLYNFDLRIQIKFISQSKSKMSKLKCIRFRSLLFLLTHD